MTCIIYSHENKAIYSDGRITDQQTDCLVSDSANKFITFEMDKKVYIGALAGNSFDSFAISKNGDQSVSKLIGGTNDILAFDVLSGKAYHFVYVPDDQAPLMTEINYTTAIGSGRSSVQCLLGAGHNPIDSLREVSKVYLGVGGDIRSVSAQDVMDCKGKEELMGKIKLHR